MESPVTDPFITTPGGIPTRLPDLALCIVFLVLFVGFAAFNCSRFILNKRRFSYTFVPSMLQFGFSMSRITTCAVRIAWEQNPTNKGLAIAASILLNAGTLLLLVVALVYAFRLFTQYHPTVSTQRFITLPARLYLLSAIPLLVMLISSGVQMFLTTDPTIQTRDLSVRKTALVWLVVYAVAPVNVALLTWIIGEKSDPATEGRNEENYFTMHHDRKLVKPAVDIEADTHQPYPPAQGILTNASVQQGSLWFKSLLIVVPAVLLALEYSIKVAQTFLPKTKARGNWLFGKGTLWGLTFTIEVAVLSIWALGDVPRRFGYVSKT